MKTVPVPGTGDSVVSGPLALPRELSAAPALPAERSSAIPGKQRFPSSRLLGERLQSRDIRQLFFFKLDVVDKVVFQEYSKVNQVYISVVAQLCPSLCDLMAVALQAPLSWEFFRQEYWSGLPCPSPRDLPNPGIKPRSPALRAGSLPSEPPGKPPCIYVCVCVIYIHSFRLFSQWAITDY